MQVFGTAFLISLHLSLLIAGLALTCCAEASYHGPQNHQLNSLMLSNSSFVNVRMTFCLLNSFIWREPPAGPYLQMIPQEACARTCWDRPNCRGFRLAQRPPFSEVCDFFEFDRCSEDLVDSRCEPQQFVWLRFRTESAGLSRLSPLCPISFHGYRHGSVRFRLVSVAGQPEGWLGGLHACGQSKGGLVKFADAENLEEAAYLRWLLKDSQVEAAYLSGYFGFKDEKPQWLWQPCMEPISDEVLSSGLVKLWHGVTVAATEGWNGTDVNFAICECVDPFQVTSDEA